MHAIYHHLTSWYQLLDPPEDHEVEAKAYAEALFKSISTPAVKPRLLELGSGAGHNALWLKSHFDCTLSDLSEPMLALSRANNPECRHVQGDMRELRLGQTFDAVIIHDAIVYMTTEEDLTAAVKTAFLHLRPGGAAIFAPDCVRESMVDQTEIQQADSGDRSFRCVYWTWDPDPSDCTVQVDYSLLLREGAQVTAVHDRHIEGLFAIEDWYRILRGAGFDVRTAPRVVSDPSEDGPCAYFDHIFVCWRP